MEVLQVILAGQVINCLKPYIEQNSFYLLISGQKSLKWFLILWILLRIQFPLNSKLMLKSPRI